MAEKPGRTGVGGQIFLVILAVLTGAIAGLFGSAALSGPTVDWAAAGGMGAFGAVSAFFLLGAVLMSGVRREEQRIAERQQADPERPWLWSDEWRDGRFRSWGTKTGAVVMLVLASSWDAITIGGIWALKAGGNWSGGTVIWAIAFSAAALFLTGYAIYGILQQWKYPAAVFEMAGVPGVLGGHLAGSVQVPEAVPPEAEASVSIRCERVWKGGRQSSVVKLWEDRRQLLIPTSRSVPVQFTIPYDLPPSDAPGSAPANPIRWHLTVRARTRGVDYEALFQNVPVFATEASAPSIVRGAVDVSTATERPPDAQVRIVEDGPDRTVFALPSVKGVGCGLASLVVLPLITWLIARSVATEPLEVVVATVVALLVAAGILAVLCLGVAFTPARIEIASDRLDVLLGSWPFHRTRTIPIADILEIKYTTGQVGGYVEARTQGKEHTISGTLKEVDEAKWLAAEVTRTVERRRGQGTMAPR